MKKPFRIWIATAGGLAALLAATWLFFMLSSFGFVHMTVLHWLLFASGINLLVALSMWLCREKLRTGGAKIALTIVSVLAGLAVAFVFFMVSIFMAMGATTMYTRYTISRSPEGSNRVIIYQTGFDHDVLVASPMVNRWVYRRGPTHWLGVRGWHYTPQIEWLGEYRARVRLLSYGGEELDLPDGSIVVEF
ncbi:MAG: hypothetical protein FWD06_07705 [Oscillospiraceae bacterium]|nr:hypothetical protein [Oscillospiraceae bacterium]